MSSLQDILSRRKLIADLEKELLMTESLPKYDRSEASIELPSGKITFNKCLNNPRGVTLGKVERANSPKLALTEREAALLYRRASACENLKKGQEDSWAISSLDERKKMANRETSRLKQLEAPILSGHRSTTSKLNEAISWTISGAGFCSMMAGGVWSAIDRHVHPYLTSDYPEMWHRLLQTTPGYLVIGGLVAFQLGLYLLRKL